VREWEAVTGPLVAPVLLLLLETWW